MKFPSSSEILMTDDVYVRRQCENWPNRALCLMLLDSVKRALRVRCADPVAIFFMRREGPKLVESADLFGQRSPGYFRAGVPVLAYVTPAIGTHLALRL